MYSADLPYRNKKREKPGFCQSFAYMFIPCLFVAIVFWIYLPAEKGVHADIKTSTDLHFERSIAEMKAAIKIIEESGHSIPQDTYVRRQLVDHLSNALDKSMSVSYTELYQIHPQLPREFFDGLVPSISKMLNAIYRNNAIAFAEAEQSVDYWFRSCEYSASVAWKYLSLIHI